MSVSGLIADDISELASRAELADPILRGYLLAEACARVEAARRRGVIDGNEARTLSLQIARQIGAPT